MTKASAERILGITGTYDAHSLRKAYAREVRRWHPDLQHGDVDPEEVQRHMIQVNLAYDYLEDFVTNGRTSTAVGSSDSSQSGQTGQAQGAPRQHWTPPASERPHWTPPQSSASTGAAGTAGPSGNASATGTAGTAGSSGYANATGSSGPSSAGQGGAGANATPHPSGAASTNTGPSSSASSTSSASTSGNTPPKYDYTPFDVDAEIWGYDTTGGSQSDTSTAPSDARASRPSATGAHRVRRVLVAIVRHFPWRIALLAVVLIAFASPAHAGMDYITHFGTYHWVELYQGGFADFLLWQFVIVPVAFINLLTGFITNIIREFLMWILDRP